MCHKLNMSTYAAFAIHKQPCDMRWCAKHSLEAVLVVAHANSTAGSSGPMLLNGRHDCSCRRVRLVLPVAAIYGICGKTSGNTQGNTQGNTLVASKSEIRRTMYVLITE